jgi:hypothetical protein
MDMPYSDSPRLSYLFSLHYNIIYREISITSQTRIPVIALITQNDFQKSFLFVISALTDSLAGISICTLEPLGAMKITLAELISD